MKKSTSLKVMLFLLLGCIIVLILSGGEKRRTFTAIISSPKASQSATNGEVPSRSLSWDELPVYPGVSLVKRAVTTPIIEMVKSEYEKVDHRYYNTADSEGQVASFFLTEMPRKGWSKVMSMNLGGLSFLNSWQRNDGEIGVTITTLKSGQGEGTNFLVIKAQGRK